MKYKTRKVWKNHIGDQVFEPLRIYLANSITDLQNIVKRAEHYGTKVKAVGSGHSWSDVCKTSGFLIEPQGLNKVLEIDHKILKNGTDTSKLVKVESGITIRELNEHLDKNGLGLKNMGGYDAQTIIGATATSTHGSGINYGPLSDMILSMEIVGSNSKIYRVESTNGISNPAKYAAQHPDHILIQNDQYLEACKVSLGCIGLVYSVIIEVRDAYYLKERRTLRKWTDVKNDLIHENILAQHDHYEILIHPYTFDNEEEYQCLITIREEVPNPQNVSKDKLIRNVMTELFSKMSITSKVLNTIFNKIPKWTEEMVKTSIEALQDDSYINKSYKVYNIGAANEIPSYSSEIALPLYENRYIDGIEHMLHVMIENRKLGELYQTAPIALRFVKASESMMSPQYKRNTCMVEIIMIKDTHGGQEMYEILENELYAFGGRPHWGQYNFVTKSKIDKYNLYPAMDKWIDVKDQINSTGVFDNLFSSRIGAS